MASKTRFQSKPGSVTKGGALGSMSKAPAGSSKLQVFLNGKMVTPVSLLYSARASAQKGVGGAGGGAGPVAAAQPKVDTAAVEKIKSSGSQDDRGLPRAESERRMSTVPPKKKRGGKKEDEMVVVEVEETETQIVFSLTSLTAANDTRDVQVTEDRNKKYE